MLYIHHCESPLGRITLASDGEALAGLWFDGQKHFGGIMTESWEEREIPVFTETRHWLETYFSGKDPEFTPRISIHATDFRKTVWNILLTIPYGKTMTYGEIADRVAEELNLPRMAAQAVGGAVGHNPISLVIPCHRVIGKDGSLTGYAGGIERKRKLLEAENAFRTREPMDRNLF
jgi:methylated-DNA-[protein]-cysteine S-methyltransferase